MSRTGASIRRWAWPSTSKRAAVRALWDFTHKDINMLGWLGTDGVPIWNDTRHQLDLGFEWRQFFDR